MAGLARPDGTLPDGHRRIMDRTILYGNADGKQPAPGFLPAAGIQKPEPESKHERQKPFNPCPMTCRSNQDKKLCRLVEHCFIGKRRPSDCSTYTIMRTRVSTITASLFSRNGRFQLLKSKCILVALCPFAEKPDLYRMKFLELFHQP